MSADTLVLEGPAVDNAPPATEATPAGLTILVPTYRDDVSRLIRALAECEEAARAPLIVFDDGSGDAARLDAIRTGLQAYPGRAELIASPDNLGRAGARNALLAAAQTDWVILLDADMVPDDSRFLVRYREAIDTLGEPGLICGGGSALHVEDAGSAALHLAQSRSSECLSAETRNADPGRFVFTANIAVHRAVFDAIPLDPGYSGWGWEDIDWGLSIARRFPVHHIDNTATHLGLMDDKALLAKYSSSGANFARLAQRHPAAVAAMPLFKAARAVRPLGPLRPPLRELARGVASLGLAPMGLRLFCLKLFRALVYSRDL